MSRLRWPPLSNDAIARLALVAAFVISRILFAASGVGFDAGGVNYYWQFLPPAWLRADLLENLFYLHSQPPLFNLFLGIVEQLPRAYWTIAFHSVYLAIGLALCLLIYGLCRRLLSFGPGAAAAAAFGFSISSQAILYENWLFYVYPVTLFITATVFFLVKFGDDRKASNLVCAVATAALASFTWGLFHFIWLFGLAAIIIALSSSSLKAWRSAIFSIAIVLFLIAGLSIKNLTLYGVITPTTWNGMNLAVMTHGLPQRSQGYPGIIKRMLETDQISSASRYKPFSEGVTEDPEFLQSLRYQDVPMLSSPRKPGGQANYHHEAYIAFSALLLRDTLIIIREHPDIYFRSIIRGAFDSFFRPSSDYLELNRASKNREQILSWDEFCRTLLLQNAARAEIDNSLKSLGPKVDWSIAAYGQFIMIALALAFAGARAVKAVRDFLRTLEASKDAIWLAISWILLWVMIVPLLVNGIETNRIRFVIEPLIFVVFLHAARDWIWRPLRHRRRAQ